MQMKVHLCVSDKFFQHSQGMHATQVGFRWAWLLCDGDLWFFFLHLWGHLWCLKVWVRMNRFLAGSFHYHNLTLSPLSYTPFPPISYQVLYTHPPSNLTAGSPVPFWKLHGGFCHNTPHLINTCHWESGLSPPPPQFFFKYIWWWLSGS